MAGWETRPPLKTKSIKSKKHAFPFALNRKRCKAKKGTFVVSLLRQPLAEQAFGVPGF
jgi:hypothetical protein